jgi:hypothetical protein
MDAAPPFQEPSMKPEMWVKSQACDPALHTVCTQLANRCTNIIRPLLRNEEIGECLKLMYIAAREVLDKPPVKTEEV